MGHLSRPCAGTGMPAFRAHEFFFRTVAGDRDEFVPASSSIEPFPDEFRAVVPGNHLEIVKPVNSQHQSFALVVDALVGGPKKGRPDVDGARIAVELGDFQKAVDTLLPNAGLLDSDALASLALALEGLGRGAEALSVLEKHFKGGTSSTDAQESWPGRLKRRWLVGRVQSDLDRAKELYSDALRRSEAKETTLRPIITPSTSLSWTSYPRRPIPMCQSLSTKWPGVPRAIVLKPVKRNGDLRRRPRLLSCWAISTERKPCIVAPQR